MNHFKKIKEYYVSIFWLKCISCHSLSGFDIKLCIKDEMQMHIMTIAYLYADVCGCLNWFECKNIKQEEIFWWNEMVRSDVYVDLWEE